MQEPASHFSMRIVSTLVVLTCLCSTAVFGQAAQPGERVERGREFLGLAPPPDPEAAARGQKLFLQNCAFCHGQNATGAEGPDLVRSSIVLHDEHGETVGPVVSKGRPDRGMPAFPSFTEEQLRDIAAFLHSRVEAAANRWGYKMQNVVTGNAQQGQTFFGEHCTSCHSATGDLAHIASKFQPADLQAQFLYPTSSKAPTTVVVTSPDGQQVKGKLKQIDDFNVSIWDDSGRYRSWSRDQAKVEISDPLAGHRTLLDLYTNTDMHNVLSYLETLK